ncbi:hypothetical protein BALAC2494_01804 [Bifidobacterium animalis subsp. lactis CNCM I-2494]|uniref:Uncharacterized protein n=1 Tax=Bifidobacterium animalis subsp. lactis CNCM I-2494 TaxID=1042403 RepID=A0A806FHM8_BIFAN|nr:hypothetical protein BALAC2494_01804 [Bifidobacterium animalis subsp. lactis CNCM I-2494]
MTFPAAHCTETSERLTTATLIYGTACGNIRRFGHNGTHLRHGSRKHPKTMPRQR